MERDSAARSELEKVIEELEAEKEQLRAGYRSVTQRLIGLRMVQHIAQELATELDVDRLLSRILRTALDAVDGTAGSLLLLDPGGQELIFAVVEGGRGAELQGQRMSADRGLAGWVVRHNQPVIVDDAQHDTRFFREITAGTEMKVGSVLCAPLVTRDQVIGALQILNKAQGAHFDDDDLDLLTAFAAQSATAIESARLYQELRRERDRLIAVDEEARRRLARDLHDGPAQMLASMMMTVEFIQRLLDRFPERVPEELADLHSMGERALYQVRTLLFELRPVILETRGLAPALEAYVDRQRSEGNLQYHLDVGGFSGRLTPTAERTIFDIIQEAVGNVKKHARAQNVWIALAVSDDRLLAGVRDDGRGFEVERMKAEYGQRASLGMLNMEERAQAVGGKLSIQSEPGAGTTIGLSAPLKPLRAEGSS
ncbi:MAG: GAF domain-containing sensor histidine kinase [Anaerolineae bacterium]|nr:GAF domain-containing sensor histidine kinase [Anaerolineae bacterium]